MIVFDSAKYFPLLSLLRQAGLKNDFILSLCSYLTFLHLHGICNYHCDCSVGQAWMQSENTLINEGLLLNSWV